MRFTSLTPIHGWRAFWGEVGIIVIGVLIALGARQVAMAPAHRRGAGRAGARNHQHQRASL